MTPVIDPTTPLTTEVPVVDPLPEGAGTRRQPDRGRVDIEFHILLPGWQWPLSGCELLGYDVLTHHLVLTVPGTWLAQFLTIERTRAELLAVLRPPPPPPRKPPVRMPIPTRRLVGVGSRRLRGVTSSPRKESHP